MESAIAPQIADQEANLFVWRPRRKLNTILFRSLRFSHVLCRNEVKKPRSHRPPGSTELRETLQTAGSQRMSAISRHTDHICSVGRYISGRARREDGQYTITVSRHGVFVLEGESIVRLGRPRGTSNRGGKVETFFHIHPGCHIRS